jgi:hypothetical protein
MPKRSSKPPRDENEAAFDAVARLTGQHAPSDDELRSQAAAILGSMGGKKGGPARAKSLTKARRSEIAKKAAKARWKGKKKPE